MRRATLYGSAGSRPHRVSIHARRATGDRRRRGLRRRGRFQFTPVVRRATHADADIQRLMEFQFTPVVRRATPTNHKKGRQRCFNSRPSCDGRPRHEPRGATVAVSIHARRATGDMPFALPRAPALFQFTPVVRRATLRAAVARSFASVSIHARRATGDTSTAMLIAGVASFNSRPSCDGRPF